MKKSTFLLALAPLALVACVNPGSGDAATQEASASTTPPGAVAAPMHGWPESNG